jgi:hypothetical protein
MTRQAVEAIIVPGRGIGLDGTLPLDPKSRVRKAAQLLTSHPLSHVVMSGRWTFLESQVPLRTEASAMKDYARILGVPESRIILEDRAVDTIGNALFTKTAVLVPRGWRNLIVVSSPDHLPRVEYVFRHVLGPGYNLEFMPSDNVLSGVDYTDSVQRELRAAQITREFFAGIQPGDHKGILKMLRDLHPGYSEHPKYTVEDLISKLTKE